MQMALSIISILKVGAYERAHSEQNKNAAQTVVGNVQKKIKADFPADDKPEGEVKRQANKWETFDLFWVKSCPEQKIKSDKRV